MQPNDNIGDANVERLLGASYKPESPDPEFVLRVSALMQTTAQSLAARAPAPVPSPSPLSPSPSPETERLRKIRWRLGWAMATAACVAGAMLLLHALDRPTDRRNGSAQVPDQSGGFPDTKGLAQTDGNPGLKPRQRNVSPAETKFAVGGQIATGDADRRRVVLADESVLYLNANTEVNYAAPRHLQLVKGEVYVEVSPQPADSRPATFVVKAPGREVKALGTRFSVWAEGEQSGVAVTQGKVQVSGLEGLVHAGQQLAPDGNAPTPAPRASHQLDWTRELMCPDNSLLVPRSQHAGGSLIAVDPTGQETRLTMRKYLVDVHIEDGFARTTIDQTYFNETWSRLEGTFYFPLPADATLSRLAMYVKDGDKCKLMEGGMAERDHARNVFETILHMRRDPALLEWVDGSTFKMRVFPLEPREEKRLILSYTQKLPTSYAATQYRFPAGHSLEKVRELSFEARVKNGVNLRCFSPSHAELTAKPDATDLLLTLRQKDARLNKDVGLSIVDDGGGPAAVDVPRFSSFIHENSQFLMVRYLPLLPQPAQVAKRDWVFLFETSGNRDPLLARAQIEVIGGILANAQHDDTFTILTANTRVGIFDAKPRAATAQNIEQARIFLEGVHLIGALDLGQAFAAAEPILKAVKNPYLVHVGSGVATLGQRSEPALMKLIPAGTKYVGIGVGKQWGRAFMKQAAERTGGYFTQINPDEPIQWRTFDLMALLSAPRVLGIEVEGVRGQESGVRSLESGVGGQGIGGGKSRFLVDGTMAGLGEEICAVTRIDLGKKDSSPEKVVIRGKVDGKEFSKEFPVEHVTFGAGYLPRQWAKLELDRLLAEDGEKNKPRIIELSKESYVMTPYTSLLVLETEEDYARFKVDRGRKDHWAMYQCPDKIPVVFEGNNAQPVKKEDPKELEKQKVLGSILVRTPPQLVQLANWPHVPGPAAVTAGPYISNPPILQIFGPVDSRGSLTGILNTGPFDASFVADQLTAYYGDVQLSGSPQIKANQTTNSIVVTGTIEEINDVKQRISALIGSKDQGIGPIGSSPGASVVDPLAGMQVIRLDAIQGKSVPRPGTTGFGTGSGLGGFGSGVGGFGGSGAGGGKGAGAAGAGRGGGAAGGGMGGGGTAAGGKPFGNSDIKGPRLPVTTVPLSELGVVFLRAQNPNDLREVLEIIGQQKNGKTPIPDWGKQIKASSFDFALPSVDRPASTFYPRGLYTSGLSLNLPIAGESRQPGEKTYAFNVAGVSWKKTLDWLSEIAGLPLGTTFIPTGTINFIPPKDSTTGQVKKYTVGEIIDILNELLVPQKYLIIRGQASIVIRPADEPIDPMVVKSLTIRELDGPLGKNEFVRVTYPLSVMQAEPFAPGVKKMMSSFSQVIPLKEANQLILIDNVASLRVVVQTIQKIEADMGGWPSVSGLPYDRPSFTADPRVFGDLLWYAPGMNTSLADIQAVLEAEAPPEMPAKQGTIDPEARQLIDKARGLGWQKLTIEANGRAASFAVCFNGAGHFAWDRVLETGLREQVICDGTTLWHLYPEIGLGAKRPVSRFHRAELLDLVPWLLPSADELALGTDVRHLEKSAISLVPRRAERNKDAKGNVKPYLQTNLQFGEDGRLAERQVVLMPENTIVARQRFSADGTIAALDPTSAKVLAEVKLQIAAAEAPSLTPDLQSLVVVPMPLRTRQHWEAKLKGDFERCAEQDAIGLLASYAAHYPQAAGNAIELYGRRFHSNNDRRIGFYVLLASAGAKIDPAQKHHWAQKDYFLDVVADHPDTPLAHYLDYHFESQRTGGDKTDLVDLDGPAEGFIQRLGKFRGLLSGWQSGRLTRAIKQNASAHERTVQFLGKAPLPIYGWALLVEMCRRGVGGDSKVHAALAETPKLFADDPELSFSVRYEIALGYFQGETKDPAQGRQLLRKLYLDTLEVGILPPLDPSFRDAMATAPAGSNEQNLSDLLHRAGDELAKHGQHLEILTLVEQARQLGQLNLAEELLTRTIAQCRPGLPRCYAQLAAVQFYRHTQQIGQADNMLRQVLAEDPFKSSAALWRIAADLAHLRQEPARGLACLEQAMELEFRELPPVVDLQSFGNEYGQLLNHYQQLASAMLLLEQKAPGDFLAKVVRAADRWRSVSPDPLQACMLAGRVLRTAGAADLAWDYYTTPLGHKPNESAPWLNLAKALQADNSPMLADRALAQAFDAEPTNAQILWDRAANLVQAGRANEARALYQLLADGQWQDRFLWLQNEAKRKLAGR